MPEMWWNPEDDGNDLRAVFAEQIVAWVIANGGEARYEPEVVQDGSRNGGKWFTSRIAVRTVDGWAYAAPGDYIHWLPVFYVERVRPDA